MKHYNLLFKGVETNKRPLDLTDAEFEKIKADLAGSDFELVLHPKTTEIEWFINLSTETAEMLCNHHQINPHSVSVYSMIFLYEIYQDKFGR